MLGFSVWPAFEKRSVSVISGLAAIEAVVIGVVNCYGTAGFLRLAVLSLLLMLLILVQGCRVLKVFDLDFSGVEGSRVFARPHVQQKRP